MFSTFVSSVGFYFLAECTNHDFRDDVSDSIVCWFCGTRRPTNNEIFSYSFGEQGIYQDMNYLELEDIDLTKSISN